MFAHAGELDDRVDTDRGQVIGVTDAGQLQQLGRVERTAAQDHLGGTHGVSPHPAAVLDADGAGPLEAHLLDVRQRDDVQVRTVHHRVQVGARGAQSTTAEHVLVERGEALLAVAVDIVAAAEPGLHARFQPGLEQRRRRRAPLQRQRPVAAAPVVRPGETGLHPLEVRQAVRVVPLGHARGRGPLLVVHRVAPLEDHPVDARRAAEHLAPRVRDPPAVHVGLRLGLVAPVVEAAADRVGQRRRHVDEDVPAPVAPARLQHNDPDRWIGAESVRERAPCRSAADDHDIRGAIGSVSVGRIHGGCVSRHRR